MRLEIYIGGIYWSQKLSKFQWISGVFWKLFKFFNQKKIIKLTASFSWKFDLKTVKSTNYSQTLSHQKLSPISPHPIKSKWFPNGQITMQLIQSFHQPNQPRVTQTCSSFTHLFSVMNKKNFSLYFYFRFIQFITLNTWGLQ